MSQRVGRHGATLMETLVAGLIALIVGGGMAALVQTTLTSRGAIAGQNNAYAGARKAMDTLLDNLRSAQPMLIQSNPALYSALAAAGASSVTCYTSSTGDTLRLWLDTTTNPAALKETRTVNGSATTTTVLTGVQSLQLTYYVVAGSAYTAASASWTTTASPSAPTSVERPNIGAISVAITVNINGYSRTLTSFVRLRGSPYKG